MGVQREDIHIDEQQTVPTVLLSTDVAFGGAGEVADSCSLIFPFKASLWYCP